MTGAVRVAAWLALIVLLACACLWSTADRLARQGALLGLPPVFLSGGNALVARAWAAYRADDLAAARSLAQAAVERRPADAAALRVAGLVAIASGEARRGDALMRLAGAGGWRDLPTQLYWADVALNAGEHSVAAERLDAVLRMMPAHPRGATLLRQLEATPAGRAALIARLHVPNGWAPIYLTNVAGLDRAALEARVATVRAARQAGLSVPSTTVVRLARALVASGDGDLAEALQPRPAGQWINDFRLLTGSETGPFDWLLEQAAGLEATIEPSGTAHALRIVASGPALLPVAQQVVRLPVGRAGLIVRVDGAKTALPLIATLNCIEGTGASAAPAAAAPGHFAALLTVPVGCPSQRLVLSLAGEEARRGADLRVSAPRLAPLAAAAP